MDANHASNVEAHHETSYTFSEAQLQDLRARQRTTSGYYRTALGEFSFALLVLKLFEPAFWGIGILYTVFGIVLFLLGRLRNTIGTRRFIETNGKAFTTCGPIVMLTTLLALCTTSKY
jgi:hypothetical protein